ncbi:3-deoxy-D-manno-octulosonic acid transferase [Xylophilus sp. GOD-11R]|uniref:3-deoxy-D-manno-octulosonic acid transferase n=1 Tax=Xylophilus sp. GOD-11R TaxID=3089814 RepID=UPI00298C1A73|nr:3-deoxy-D-manno-octulosonic acid transferase [Xylophilus sp. GOD-11R]WPB59399.1 3-deoxy-D-manno-octulosonic acid transferase [Xylophilus sp. GOD-11R]
MTLAQPLLRRKLRRRGEVEAGYLESVEERFGRYPAEPLAPGGPRIWIHAVSLGETRAAGVLVAALRQRIPGMRLLLTHGTATGRAEGGVLLLPGDAQTWQPWDTAGAVGRFLAHFRPDIGVLMETEVWPNLVAGCRDAGVPLVLANARLSDKSLRGAERLGVLARPAFAALTAVWAQSDDDARRLAGLGAPVGGVFGNLKFDMTPDPVQQEAGRRWRRATGRPVVLLASSREGEEAMWIEAFRSRSAGLDDVQWLIVPRHPQRFDEVAALLEAGGLAVSRRSGWAPVGPDDAPPRADVWLGDSLGEMARYYGMADVALLGGSFAMTGGQNLIEAAACGCPVVMGPSTFNFAEASALAEAAGAAFRVADMTEAVGVATSLVADAGRLGIARGAALSFASAHRGAAARTADALCALLAKKTAR